MKVSTKSLRSEIFRAIKAVLITLLYFVGLFAGIKHFSDYLSNPDFGIYFIWLYLMLGVSGLLYYQSREYFAWKNIKVFLKIISIIFLFLSVLMTGLVLISDSFENQDYASYFIWSYLLLSFLIYYAYKKKVKLNKENFSIISKNMLLNSIYFGKLFLKYVGYLALIVIAIIIIFLLGGWIASLSATTVIIVLLIIIALK